MKKLKVQPIRKYKTPKYPSYLDKNPIEYPEVLPYPFKSKMLHGLLLTGLFTSISVVSPEPTTNLPKNTFPLERTGLPHTPASYGTGLSSKMDARIARETIFKIFAKEGIPLQKDYLYKKDDLEIQLDGYNEQKKIGFSWLTYQNINVDNVNRYDPIGLSRNIEDFENKARYFRFPNPKESYEIHFKSKIEELKSAPSISKQALRKLDYERVTYAIVHKKDANPFLKAKAKEAFNLPKEQQADAFEYVFFRVALKHYTDYMNRRERFQDFSFYAKENAHAFKGKTLKQYYEVAHLLTKYAQAWWMLRDYEEEINQYLIQFGQSQNIEQLHQQLNAIASEKMSNIELNNLEKHANKNKTFIAPVSSFDDRFQYPFYRETRDEEVYKKLWEAHNETEIKAASIKDKEERAAFIKEEEFKASMKYPTQQMQELEKQVRQYIRWAKSQGMY